MSMAEESATVDVAETDTGPEPTETQVKAREQGWVPKAEFKGKSDSWTDADEYLKRGDPKYLRERLRTVEKAGLTAKQELARQMAEQDAVFKDRLDRMGKASSRALEIQRDRIYAEFDAKKLAAVEDGDTAKYREVQKQETATREKFAEEDAELADKPVAKVEKATNTDPDVDAWVKDNIHIYADKRLWDLACGIYNHAENGLALKTGKERIAFLEQELARADIKTAAAKRKPKDEDSELPEPRMPSVEGGARVASNGARKKGWADIPAEEKAIYTKHIKEKLYKDQAEAASVHWSE